MAVHYCTVALYISFINLPYGRRVSGEFLLVQPSYNHSYATTLPPPLHPPHTCQNTEIAGAPRTKLHIKTIRLELCDRRDSDKMFITLHPDLTALNCQHDSLLSIVNMTHCSQLST